MVLRLGFALGLGLLLLSSYDVSGFGVNTWY